MKRWIVYQANNERLVFIHFGMRTVNVKVQKVSNKSAMKKMTNKIKAFK